MRVETVSTTVLSARVKVPVRRTSADEAPTFTAHVPGSTTQASASAPSRQLAGAQRESEVRNAGPLVTTYHTKNAVRKAVTDTIAPSQARPGQPPGRSSPR